VLVLGVALSEVQDGGLPCGSIKASAEGGLETAKRFKVPGQLRKARRAAAMEQGNPPSCAGAYSDQTKDNLKACGHGGRTRPDHCLTSSV
jgi:hypothetical protein